MFEPPVAVSKVPNGQSDQRNLSPPKLTLPTRSGRHLCAELANKLCHLTDIVSASSSPASVRSDRRWQLDGPAATTENAAARMKRVKEAAAGKKEGGEIVDVSPCLSLVFLTSILVYGNHEQKDCADHTYMFHAQGSRRRV
jgi:hypothetical protein